MKRNPIISGEMTTIPLTRGLSAFVDLADLPLVSGTDWFADEIRSSGRFYACRTVIIGGSRRAVRMHSIIMGSTEKIDHVDGDGLNNRRANLRLCTTANGNQANQARSSINTSGFKGVVRTPCGKPWLAQIQVNGENIYLGRFDDKGSAALAYDVAARKYFGEFARTNFSLDLANPSPLSTQEDGT